MLKLSLIGAGNLGAAIAQEIAGRGLVDELVLIDILKDLAEGQAADIQQSLPTKNRTKVYSGDYLDIKNSNIIIITAGKPRTAEMKNRLVLTETNLRIVGSIIEQVKKYYPYAIIITITNPMDIINHFIHKQGFPREKVIGSGGQLDSARFRVALGFPEQEVEAYVLGEHGEDQVPIFSRVKVNGQPKAFSEEEKVVVKDRIRQAALTVIQKKGATVFAPAVATADMVEAIIKDQKKLMICSVNLQGEYGLHEVSLGVPVILGRKGVEKVVGWEIEQGELAQLQEGGRKLNELYLKITVPAER